MPAGERRHRSDLVGLLRVDRPDGTSRPERPREGDRATEDGTSRTTHPEAKRVLLFPLSSVLGHLTRTFALAEEFHAQGHDVTIAAGPTHAGLTEALAPGIRVVPTPEMAPVEADSPTRIRHYDGGTANDRANLEACDRMDESELRRRARALERMVERDTEIVREVRPDVVITDHRFTAPRIGSETGPRVFHISHVVGYPSLYRRVMGSDYYPLDAGHILVPGIRDIEYWNRDPVPPTAERRETFCGIFRWGGWRRLQRDAPEPPAADVFFSFGSTGNGKRLVPWLLGHLSERYRVSGIAPGLPDRGALRHANVSERGDLGAYLDRAEVAVCHGGHGTVMECILHRTPMLIFAHNLEQLEIGRRVEEMGLGILVKRPHEQLAGEELSELIETLRTDEGMRANLERYSALLRDGGGPRRAVSIVLRSLAN